MHVSTQLPSPARAKPLTRRGRREAAEAAEAERHHVYLCDYEPFDYHPDDLVDVQRPDSVAAALERCHRALWADSGPLQAPPRAPALRPVAAPAPPAPPSPDALPRALFEHVDALLWWTLGVDDDDVARWEALRPSLAAARVRLDRATAGTWVASPALVYASLLAPFWVRAPEAWRPPTGADRAARAASLVRHLFALYPAHDALLRAWGDASDGALKWVCWYVLVAQGASLRRAARWFGWGVAKGFAHHFAQAPTSLDAAAACRHAEIARLGGGADDLARVERHPGWALDPTERPGGAFLAWTRRCGEEFFFDGVSIARQRAEEAASLGAQWSEAAAWVVRHRAALTDDSAEEALDWALHALTERARAGERAALAWGALTPGRVRAMAGADRLLAQRAWSELRAWQRRGWDARAEGGWAVEELATAAALYAEGDAMRHCVGGYVGRCEVGTSAIFSVRRDGRRVATVEVEPRTMALVQVRGPQNAPVDAATAGVVARWIAGVREGKTP